MYLFNIYVFIHIYSVSNFVLLKEFQNVENIYEEFKKSQSNFGYYNMI